MKNATQAEVEEAKRTGVLREDRMYEYEFGEVRFHGKQVKACIQYLLNNYYQYSDKLLCVVVAETADGELCLVNLDYIRSPIKGPSQTPKKQRKPHVKGTKPERKIPFTADMRLKEGDKVLLSSGLRGVIGRVDTSDVPYYVDGYAWFHSNGKQLYWPDSITHIILPFEGYKITITNSSVGTLGFNGIEIGKIADFNYTSSAIVTNKTKEQQDFEAGYWVPWVATKDSVCPKWAEDVPVETLWDDSCKMPVVNGLFWLWDNLRRHIVAYRKAE